jgi:2-keto-4-pentenoate hydratase/2-oxohepta-3-ene-1,7-dioic acid hydratase in catechol pathway
MKICRVQTGSRSRYAYEDEGRIRLFPEAWVPGSELPTLDPDSIAADEVQGFLPPVNPSKIVCVGRNYAAHAAELNNPLPIEPLLFLKAPSALITEGETIVLPGQSAQVEHEGELGVVIGRDCKSLGEDENPYGYVLGYVCVNDVTARDLQKRDVQFTRAKSFDTFCPVGRFIRTDIDVADTTVRVLVNGEIRQEGRTSDMIFDIPFLIRYISNQMTLKAGDLIATGTPSGVSVLKEGDACTVEIGAVGTLSNPVAGQVKIP